MDVFDEENNTPLNLDYDRKNNGHLSIVHEVNTPTSSISIEAKKFDFGDQNSTVDIVERFSPDHDKVITASTIDWDIESPEIN